MSGACSTHDAGSKYIQISNRNLAVGIQLKRRESKLELLSGFEVNSTTNIVGWHNSK